MAMTQGRRSLVTMVVALALAGGMGAFAYYGVLKSEEAKTKQNEEAAKIFTFDKSKVQQVSLTEKGVSSVMKKTPDGWVFVAADAKPGVAVRADKAVVDTIIDKIETLRALDLNQKSKGKAAPDYLVAQGDAELPKFGFDHPRFSVKLSLDDGSTVAVEVGDENTYDQAQYVRRGGENKVYMSDGTLKGALEKDYFALRDKAIVNHEDKDVQSFSASGNGFAWAVDRDGDGWKLTAPTRETADKSTVDGVLSRIRTTRAKAFPAEELAPADAKKYGFDPPAVQAVFLLGADKVRKTLQLGEVGEGKTKKAYAHLQEGGPVAEIEPGLIKDVQKPLSDLKDRTVAAFDKEKAKKLEVIPATGEKFVVDRSKEKAAGATFETDKFAIEGRDDKVKTWKMTSAFYTLSTLKGVAIADEHATDLSKYGLDKPEWTYVVRGDDDKELSRILIGKLSDTRYLVMKAGTERVVFVEKTVIDGLPKQPEDLLDAAPVKAPPVAAPVTASSGK